MRQPSFRSGTNVQADLLISNGNAFMAGALRSTGVTRRRHYYGPLRIPARPDDGYGFPSSVGQSAHPADEPPCRASQVPDCSFDARRPLSPRAARRLHAPVASPSVLDFAFSGRLATAKWFNEAETSSFALRLTSSSKRGFTEPVTQTRCPPDYTVNR